MPIFKRSKKKKSSPTRGRKRGHRFRLPDEGSKPWLKFVRLGITFLILGGLAVAYIATSLPDMSELEKGKKQQAITVETADGQIIATYGDVYGAQIPYEKIPKHLVQAVVATEDRRFFVHHGIDFFGIARAMVANIAAGKVVQGGSTVTQQVAKNLFLTPRRSIERKIQEALIALWLEARYSKQDIMAMYLNRVYLGGGTYGIDAASRRYYNKPATELNLVESAIIAGLLKAPSRFSPTSDVERAKARATVVMNKMVEAKFIKQAQVDDALKHFKVDELRTVEGNAARYFSDWVVDELPNYISGVQEDLVITTTLDLKLESYAKDALEAVVAKEGPPKRVSQGALVAMTPDGAVKAMVGGLSYGKSQFNRATQAKRQPGSVFKLFVYLAALEAGYTPLTPVLDEPITLQAGNKSWTPDNFTGEYLGEIPVVQALRQSLNTVSVRLSQFAGIDKVANMAMRLGIPNVPAYESIALGSVEATLLELTGAYAHLPNGGNKVVPYGILAIKTTKGKELYKRSDPEKDAVLAKGTVEMMNYMLLNVVQAGTGTRAAIGRPAAGKTGTSSDYKDAWFIGFTPQLVAGVWVGNDDNKKMAKITGGSLPAGTWRAFMSKAMQGQKVQSIPNSEGSGEGLLPWLFGGTTGEVPQGEESSGDANETPDAPSAPMEEQPTPDVGVISDGQVVNESAPLPWQQAEPASPSQPPQAAPASPPAGGEDVLTPGFWNKLMGDAPQPSAAPNN